MLAMYSSQIWLFFAQRITIPEIKKHPWFLKNLPVEFMEGEEAIQMKNTNDYPAQTVEEALAIIQEARKPVEGPKAGGGLFVAGSMDLDDIDTDADIEEDIETSGDFVCALWANVVWIKSTFGPA